jgi:hypothetical protein
MVKMRSLLAGVLLLLGMTAICSADSFDTIKKRLAEAGCVGLSFLSIVESDIFESCDTVKASATISEDGRYVVDLGNDHYLYDRTHLYSYSRDNNQVTIERARDNGTAGQEISFITRLDELYAVNPLTPNQTYRLVKRKSGNDNIPDSLVVGVRPDTTLLDWIEYCDVNGELNRIVFLDQTSSEICSDSLFVPSYPDSVERVRLF